MPTNASRVLAIAARTKRVGCVHLVDGKLVDWGYAEIDTVEEAVAKLYGWLETYKPNCLISENPETAFRKSGMQIPVLQAFVEIGKDQPVLNILLTRKKTHKNLYLEAESLAEKFPDITSRVPNKPPIWLPEHRNLVYFDALALANQVLEGNEQ